LEFPLKLITATDELTLGRHRCALWIPNLDAQLTSRALSLRIGYNAKDQNGAVEQRSALECCADPYVNWFAGKSHQFESRAYQDKDDSSG
jgi:hypothetical protein